MADIIHNLPDALLKAFRNEISLDQKGSDAGPTWDDPVKFRFGAWKPNRTGGFYLGAISGDVLLGDSNEPTRHEKMFIALKIDPDPVIELYLQRNKDTYEDADMKRVMEISAKEVRFNVPVIGQMFGTTDRLVSGDGRFCTVQQSDGNLVTYRRNPDGSLGAAVWASGYTE